MRGACCGRRSGKTQGVTRKGLIKCAWPNEIALTPEGVSYDTGIADQILHKGGGH
jgi:hypothetical protein